jgi:glutathione reductase (NADPH)
LVAAAHALHEIETTSTRGITVGPNSVEVDSNTPTGNHIVIATGSKPRPLPIPGAALTITSNEVLS